MDDDPLIDELSISVQNGIHFDSDVEDLEMPSDIRANDILQLSQQNDSELNLPNVLFIKNVNDSIFIDEDIKRDFEEYFSKIDDEASFIYLRSFRRVRISFSSPHKAAYAKILLHQSEVCGKKIECYFSQPIKKGETSPHLRPPLPDKQFLISPPASPPVGWEPINEGVPVINYDLLNALATLVPGQAHELHRQTDTQPGILVHICEDPVNYEQKTPIVQTRCPERMPIPSQSDFKPSAGIPHTRYPHCNSAVEQQSCMEIN